MRGDRGVPKGGRGREEGGAMRLSPMSSQPHDCMMTVRGTIPVMCAVDASLEASQDLRCSHTTSPMVHVRWQQSTGRTFVEQLILCKDLLPPHPLFPIHGVSRMALRYPQLIILGCAKLQSRQQHSPFPRERASFGHLAPLASIRCSCRCTARLCLLCCRRSRQSSHRYALVTACGLRIPV